MNFLQQSKIVHKVITAVLLEKEEEKKNFVFVTYTIIRRITSSEICALHLTHPSAHTLGAVGSRQCGARGAVGGSVPCSRVSPQSRTISAGAEIRIRATTAPINRCWEMSTLLMFYFLLILPLF